jgi:hypothetical protein
MNAENTTPQGESVATEGWAFLSPSGVGAHYFREGKSFCGRPLPDGVEVRGDVFGAGSDPEECRRCSKRAMDEADALDEAEDALMDAEDNEDEPHNRSGMSGGGEQE